MGKAVWTVLVAAVVGAIGFGAGWAIGDDELPKASSSSAQQSVGAVTEITRTPWGQAAPVNAPGQSLYLQQVVIPAGAALAEHVHEGTQVARVVAGTLTYDISSGTALVARADGDTDELTGPTETVLEAGDTIVETASLRHHGRNEGDEPVVVQLAALLAEDAPLATPIGDEAEGASVHLEADLESQDRTLHEAGQDGDVVYGWNHLTGTATLDGEDVEVDMLGAVSYRSGNGPFSGFITFTFDDGSTLAVLMQGVTRASDDGSNADFTATLGVIDGTGDYAGATGVGTFTGTRDAALGTAVQAAFDLRVVGR